MLNKNGVFIFEQPNFTVGATTLKFDQIYHEHVSYFTSKNIKSILFQNNLNINYMEKNKYHGGSLRTIAFKKNCNLEIFDIKKLINEEINKGIYKIGFYKSMINKIDLKKRKLLTKINKLKEKKYTIAGIGAGAKANTFLTYYQLNNNIIDFLTDSSKFKQNKFTPLTRIIIKDDIEIKKYKKIACLILSWNISKLIIQKIKKLNKRVKFVYN